MWNNLLHILVLPLVVIIFSDSAFAFSSTQYTIDSYTIGTAGTVFSSQRYILIGSVTNTMTFNGPAAAPPSSNQHAEGSRRKETVAMTSPSTTPPAITPEKQDTLSMFVDDAGVTAETRGVHDEDSNAQAISVEKEEETSDMSFAANLIAGDVRGLGVSLLGMYRSLFDTFEARLVLLIGILGILYAVRTYTNIGKKYRPF